MYCNIPHSADSPVLWVRVDPASALLRKVVRVEQPEFAWHLAALHDRDINSQLDAIEAHIYYIR